MDVPLVLNHIEILQGLQGLRNSSAFCLKTDVDGLSALYRHTLNHTE